MRRETVKLTPVGFLEILPRIHFHPPFGITSRWATPDQRALLDSVLRGFAIGKIYFWRTGETWWVVDGRHRLTTLMSFIRGELTFRDLSFKGLPPDQQTVVETYPLDVELVSQCDEATVHEMFRRLQMGKKLSVGERLQAMYGEANNRLDHILKTHAGVGSWPFPNKRAEHFKTLAQMARIADEQEVVPLEFPYLEAFLDKHREPPTPWATPLTTGLDYMYQMQMTRPAAFRKRSSAELTSLFIWVALKTRRPHPDMAAARYEAFQNKRRTDPAPDMLEYTQELQVSTTSKPSLLLRHQVLRKYMGGERAEGESK